LFFSNGLSNMKKNKGAYQLRLGRGIAWTRAELKLARSPLALMVTLCPPGIEFPLVPSQMTISRLVELLGTVRVVILLNPLAFVVLMIVLFDICTIYIFCAWYFSLYIIIWNFCIQTF
jgi:hypothetical protein